MVYEIVAYHTPYTFYASSREVAALTIFLLSTSLGAKTDSERDADIPVTEVGSPEKWYMSVFGRNTVEGMIELREEVKKSLRSFVAGGFHRRIAFMIETSSIRTDEKLEEFKKNWNRFYEGTPNLAETAASRADQIDEAVQRAKEREAIGYPGTVS